jgi:WD40 repeat protein
VSKHRSALLLGRRHVLLGFVGVVVASCSFGNTNTPALQGTKPKPTAPGVTPTPTPTQGATLFVYKGHTNWVNDLVWSPDSKGIASYPASSYQNPSSTKDYSVHVWDAVTGQDRFTHQTVGADTVATLAWSPDGTRVAMSDNPFTATPAVLLLDAQTGKTLATCNNLKNFYFFQIVWSPDSSHVAIAGNRDVEICNATTGENILTYPAVRPASGDQFSYAVGWSPDGSTIDSSAANAGHSIQFWNAQSGQPLYYFSGDKPIALAWSPDGKRIAIRTGSRIQVQDGNTGQIVFSAAAETPFASDDERRLPYGAVHPHTISWSPDGKYIALANGQKQVQIWNVASQSLAYTYSKHSDIVLAVAWSPDGSRIASTGVDTTVHVWQAL